MGVNLSRADHLPSNIDDVQVRNYIVNSWNRCDIGQIPHKGHPEPTMGLQSLETAGDFLIPILDGKSLNVLDLMSGYCMGSEQLCCQLRKSCTIENWRCTDLIDYDVRSIVYLSAPMTFRKLNSVDAVAIYGQTSNVLLLISPPPGSFKKDISELNENVVKFEVYGDYYACYDYIQLHSNQTTDEDKYIIFIGELGASDGSTGMYKYLIEHPQLILIERQMLDCFPDVYSGSVEKELFVFKLQTHLCDTPNIDKSNDQSINVNNHLYTDISNV